jgi:hypothetical protein
MSLKQYKEDFILFLEAGFIAVNQADEDAAVKLFKAAELLEPKNTLAKVGMGYLHLHKLELKQAIQSFESVVELEPDNDMAKAFLGICKTMTPREVLEGEKLLVAAEQSEDKEVKKLSSMALDFVDKFAKKAPSPAEVRKPKK